MKQIIRIFLILAAFVLAIVQTAHAQYSFAGYSLEQLETELDGAQVYQALDHANTAANGFRGCSQYNDEMFDIRQALISLTQQYEGRADSVYDQKRQQMQEQFRLANKSYEDCFAQTLADYPKLSPAGVRSVATFKSKAAELNPRFSDKGDIIDYIAAIEDAINDINNQTGAKVGVAESVFKSVEVRRGGAAWQTLSKGQAIYLQDELKTGPRGRLRISFEDRYAAGNAGPTIVNVGSDSHIKIENFLVSFNQPPRREGVVRLLRGAVRTFTKNWGPRSNFQVRAGATVCGIRGTEVAISYDPATQTATHTLDHGDAYVEAGGRQVTLTPRTSVTVKGDQIEWPVAVSEDTWLGIMNSTGDGAPGSTNTEAIAMIDQAPAPTPNLSQVTPRPNPAITMKEALETFRAYQYSILTEDKDTLLSLLMEPEKSKAIKSINKKGVYHYAFYDSKVSSWDIECAACYEDKKRGPICLISDKRHKIPTQKKNSGGAWISVYVLQNEQGISYVSKRAVSSWDWQVLTKKLKKNGRVCKFDDLTINMSNGPVGNSVPDRENDGLKTLLGGISAVLGEIK